MIINGDGGYGLLAAYIGRPAAQANWLGRKVGSTWCHVCIHCVNRMNSRKLLCHDDSTINIVEVIIIIIIIFIFNFNTPGSIDPGG